MDKKRIAFIIIFIIISIGLGYALYRVFFAPEEAPEEVAAPAVEYEAEFPETEEIEVAERPVVEEEIFPEIGVAPEALPTTEERIDQIIEGRVTDIAPDTIGQSRFYNQSDGKFYRVRSDGTLQRMSEEVFYQVSNVNWSPTRNESIIEYPDGSNIYYNFETKTQVTLPKHWEEFSFSPLGDQIAAKSMALDPENRWLITSDPTGNQVNLIEPLGNNANKVIVDWSPNKQVVALSRTGEPLGGERQQVLLVGLHGENFQSLTVEGRGLQTKWSPTGSKLLHSVYSARSDYKPELWIVGTDLDNVGSGRKLLGLNTWAEKCTFANDRFVYCGVPETLQTGAAFAPESAQDTPDRLYRIDTQTGSKVEIPLEDTSHVIEDIYVGNDGQTLYFTDINKSGLFEVEI